jgi:CBS domain-containing membrane protein
MPTIAGPRPGKAARVARVPGAPPKAPRRKAYVRDLMTENVVTFSPKDNLADLADRMADEHIRHAPIVDREGELVGLVTERDLARFALFDSPDAPLSVEREVLGGRRVREIMGTEVDTLEPDASLREAAELLLENKVGCIPIVEGRRVVGILTEADFVRRFLETE